MTKRLKPEIATSNYGFERNRPFDREAPIEMVVNQLQSSAEYMNRIRSFAVPPNSLAIWFMGQNGFILKDEDGFLIGNRSLPEQQLRADVRPSALSS